MIRFAMLFCVLLLVGCDSFVKPTSECRFSLLGGGARYGTFTQYAKGDGAMVRVVIEGTGCPGLQLRIADEATGVTLDYFWEEDAEKGIVK